MKYSDINAGQWVDAVNDTANKNYRVISKSNGWVRVQHIFQPDLFYSCRAKSLIDHDIVANQNRIALRG